MKITAPFISRAMIATALTSGLLSLGVAASAQTTAAPATAAITAPSVAISTMDAKATRAAHLQQVNDVERRVEFLHQGTSL
jgi:hypothetical protein